MTEPSGASTSPDLPIDLSHAKWYLGPDEEILWHCRCDAKRFAAHTKLALYIGTPVLLFIALITLITTFFPFPNWADPAVWPMKLPPLLFLVGLVFVFRFLLTLPDRKLKELSSAIHVLTNRRIFVSVPEKHPLWVLQLDTVDNVVSTINSDGTRDIALAYPRAGATRRNDSFTLYGVPNADAAEKQITDAVANAKQLTR